MRSIRSVIKTLDKQLQDIDGDIDQQLEQHFKPQKELLGCSIACGAWGR